VLRRRPENPLQNSRKESTMRTPSLHCLVLGWVALLATAGVAAEAPHPDSIIDEFKIAKDGDCLLVPVRLRGKSYLFVLDTGCSVTVFDSSLPLGEAQQEVMGDTPDGKVRVSLYETPAASMGGFGLQGNLPRVAGFDLSKIRQASGHEIYGIIGMDFLGKHVIQLDFDRGLLLFLNSANPDMGDVFEMTYRPRQLPSLNVHITGHGIERFWLDTGMIGYDSGTLASHVCLELTEKGCLSVVGTALTTSLSGTSSRKLLRAKALTLGDFTLRGPVFSEARFTHLGLGYLSRFTVTLDFPNQRLYLRPGKRYNRPDKWNVSGLHFLRRGGNVVVDSVDAGSGAAKAGLKVGDVILRLADVEAKRARLFELLKILCEEGTTVRVVASRAGKEFEVSMDLKR
jgi:hypothetical protein